MTENLVTERLPQVRPTAPTRRLAAPDVARGLMLLFAAIAGVRWFLYARPFGPNQFVVEDFWLDRAVSGVVFWLVDGRAPQLFALLYGYAVVQLATRCRTEGLDDRGFRAVLRRRSTGLLLLGALHALLLFPGDLLGLFGLLGFALAGVLRLGDRALAVLVGVWPVVAGIVQGVASAFLPGEERQYLRSMGLALTPELPLLRALDWIVMPLALFSLLTAAMIGVRLARHRVLEEPQRHRELLRKLVAVLLPISVLGGVPYGLMAAQVVEITSVPALVGLAALHSLAAIAGGVAVMALVALVLVRPRPRAGMLAALGRRALSGYVFVSLVFAVALSPIGFGWGAHLGTAAATGLAVLAWVAASVGAVLLDRSGRRGPLESVLRWFTRRGR